jgi:peptide-methionine (S)-S-oxide reductase
MQLAQFGMGCFWGVERIFWNTPGVWVTAAGYAGGFTPNPTYEEACSGRTGHTEAVLVVFDPAQISYEALLKLFWEGHNPTQGMRQGNDTGSQYRSAVYTYGEAQRRAAEESQAVYEQACAAAGMAHHDRDRTAERVLLRRGQPPAVLPRNPGESPYCGIRRDGRDLPGSASASTA